MMNDYEEDLEGFPVENKEKPAESVDHIAQSRQVDVQQEVESQRRFHLSLMDRRPGLSVGS